MSRAAFAGGGVQAAHPERIFRAGTRGFRGRAQRSARPAGHQERRGGSMARRPNYGFEKRQKEIEKQKKKDAKAEKKEQRRREGLGDEGEAPEAGEGGKGEAGTDGD